MIDIKKSLYEVLFCIFLASPLRHTGSHMIKSPYKSISISCYFKKQCRTSYFTMRIIWLIGFPFLVLLSENSELNLVFNFTKVSHIVFLVCQFLLSFQQCPVSHLKNFKFYFKCPIFMFLIWINSFWREAGITIKQSISIKRDLMKYTYFLNTILFKIRVIDKN